MLLKSMYVYLDVSITAENAHASTFRQMKRQQIFPLTNRLKDESRDIILGSAVRKWGVEYTNRKFGTWPLL